MTKEAADKIFSLLKNMGCGSVHIGGGEPFMNFERLLDVCKSALSHRVYIDYIETNASWFTDDERAGEKLKKLKYAGVGCLLVSVDPFHNGFVPYVKIKNLLNCCKKNGMETFVWQSRFEPVVRQLNENTVHSPEEYENLFGEGFIETIAENYKIGYNGRALRLLERFARKKRPCGDFLKDTQCRSAITSLSHFHVDPDCSLIPPSCNGFRADIFDLCENGLDGEKYANFTAVMESGLEALFKTAQTLGFVPDSMGYASKCALCFDIKKYISETVRAKTGKEPADIGPAGFFDL